MRGQKEKIESALSEAMAQLEIEDSSADDLKKKELALKRAVTKALCPRQFRYASHVVKSMHRNRFLPYYILY
ncbi:hypothetical protein V493_04206 [Pseudogymnoascus sp. VKM F-4281 (FW-2241)]|nr:hypothetical protein V493_04206 [Pseudogymnoascus sp. VKM F-4281 (FW-2241)]